MINLLKQQGGVLFPSGKQLELQNLRPLNLGYLHADVELRGVDIYDPVTGEVHFRFGQGCGGVVFGHRLRRQDLPHLPSLLPRRPRRVGETPTRPPCYN